MSAPSAGIRSRRRVARSTRSARLTSRCSSDGRPKPASTTCLDLALHLPERREQLLQRAGHVAHDGLDCVVLQILRREVRGMIRDTSTLY